MMAARKNLIVLFTFLLFAVLCATVYSENSEVADDFETSTYTENDDAVDSEAQKLRRLVADAGKDVEELRRQTRSENESDQETATELDTDEKEEREKQNADKIATGEKNIVGDSAVPEEEMPNVQFSGSAEESFSADETALKALQFDFEELSNPEALEKNFFLRGQGLTQNDGMKKDGGLFNSVKNFFGNTFRFVKNKVTDAAASVDKAVTRYTMKKKVSPHISQMCKNVRDVQNCSLVVDQIVKNKTLLPVVYDRVVQYELLTGVSTKKADEAYQVVLEALRKYAFTLGLSAEEKEGALQRLQDTSAVYESIKEEELKEAKKVHEELIFTIKSVASWNGLLVQPAKQMMERGQNAEEEESQRKQMAMVNSLKKTLDAAEVEEKEIPQEAEKEEQKQEDTEDGGNTREEKNQGEKKQAEDKASDV